MTTKFILYPYKDKIYPFFDFSFHPVFQCHVVPPFSMTLAPQNYIFSHRVRTTTKLSEILPVKPCDQTKICRFTCSVEKKT